MGFVIFCDAVSASSENAIFVGVAQPDNNRYKADKVIVRALENANIPFSLVDATWNF